MVFEYVFSNFLASFNNFVDEKYILSDNAFVRSGKWSLETAIKFPLFNRKKTKFNEVNRYLRSQTGDYSMKITGSGVCDRMQYINPKVYIDMNDGVIMEIYNNVEEMETFKGFHVFATDGSYVEIPNHPQAREEMGVPSNNEVETFAANARISCTVDTKMDFVISSIIENQTVDEITLALRHLDDVKNKINMNNVITCYDRYYNSTEIMLKTETLNSYYLIRGKTNTFKKQQQKMDNDKKTDETFDISLNNAKIKKFHDEELKKIARKQKSIQVRIVKVKLKTGQTEILFTNLPKEIATPEELKQLYGERWKIETDYDRLKNKLYIEKFRGRRRTIIEQDFYSHIFLLNLLIGIKHDAELKITRKPKETAKYTYKYHSNINTLIGEIKDQLPRLLTDNQDEIQKVIKEIMEIGSKELVATKIPPQTHTERDKKRNWNKNCKTSKSQGF